jgi:fatty acid desaturase
MTAAAEAIVHARVEVPESSRGSILKYKADRGPVAFVLGMFAAHLALWCWATPLVAALSIVPLTLLSVFVAPINHHHQHLNSFRSALLNRAYEIALALQTGVSPYAWVLHHNLGHHRNYLNQRPHARADESTWTRIDGAKMSRIEYTVDLLLRHQSDIFQVGLKHPKVLRSLLLMKLPLYGLLGLGLWWSPLNTLLIFLVPAFLTLTHTIWATYEHHAGCDTASHLSASVNRDNKLFNRLSGNLGLHTAHHMRPGIHWSLLPQLHAQIRHQIPSEQILTRFW